MSATTGTGAHVAGGPPDDAGRDEPAGGRGSLGNLFSNVTNDLSTLVRQEIELAKAELTQSATQAGKGAGMFGGAAVGGHFVLLFLSIALWWGLGNVMDRGWSALIVAAVWAVIAGVLALLGRSELKKAKGLPRTAGTVKQIPDALKGHEETTR